jgi:hypothetical protein
MLRRDEQTWMIVFEQGTLRMREWVPTRLELDVSLSDAALETLALLMPESKIEIATRYPENERKAVSRHQARTVDVKAMLTTDAPLSKFELYGEMLCALLQDQISAIDDEKHPRTVSEANGRSSLAYAIAAQDLADSAGDTVYPPTSPTIGLR